MKCRWTRGCVGEPGLDDRVLVGAVVVADQVDLEVLGDLGVDLGEELLELRGAVSAVQAGDHGAVGDVEGREQGGGAVPDVVVGAALGHPGHHRQCRLGALQGLDLGLLVHAQHHRRLGWVQVEPDDVVELVDEQRVGGELEVLDPVRLDARTCARSHRSWTSTTGPLGHLRPRPVRRVRRRGLQRRHDHVLDLVHADRGRPARARLVEQAVEAVFEEPRPPLAHRHPVTAQLLGDRGVRPAIGTRQDDLRPQGSDWAEDARRAHRVSCSRSSLVRISGAFGRPDRGMPQSKT